MIKVLKQLSATDIILHARVRCVKNAEAWMVLYRVSIYLRYGATELQAARIACPSQIDYLLGERGKDA
jgi:hypothetical protein